VAHQYRSQRRGRLGILDELDGRITGPQEGEYLVGVTGPDRFGQPADRRPEPVGSGVRIMIE